MKKPYRQLNGRIVASGETCKSVAEQIHISPQAMSAKMQGKSFFTAAEMAAIGEILHFTELDYYTYFIIPMEKKGILT